MWAALMPLCKLIKLITYTPCKFLYSNKVY
jgi:hypothetical protein